MVNPSVAKFGFFAAIFREMQPCANAAYNASDFFCATAGTRHTAHLKTGLRVAVLAGRQ